MEQVWSDLYERDEELREYAHDEDEEADDGSARVQD